MTEEKKIENEPKNAIAHHQSKLMKFIMSDEAATVQSLIDGDELGETVREGEYQIEYECFTLKGVEARINIDLFESMPERLTKMQDQTDDDGKPAYTKEGIKTFIKKWCFNKVKANGSGLPTREDFMTLVKYLEEIVFNNDDKLRHKPPKGIDKTKAVSNYKTWESKKFRVKITTEAYINLENKVRKLRKKGLKKDIYNLEAETEKVAFLQSHMKLKAGEYCSGPEFAAYFKEISKAMYPNTFGIPDKIPTEKATIDKKQTPIIEVVEEEDNDEDIPKTHKKKTQKKASTKKKKE